VEEVAGGDGEHEPPKDALDLVHPGARLGHGGEGAGEGADDEEEHTEAEAEGEEHGSAVGDAAGLGDLDGDKSDDGREAGARHGAEDHARGQGAQVVPATPTALPLLQPRGHGEGDGTEHDEAEDEADDADAQGHPGVLGEGALAQGPLRRAAQGGHARAEGGVREGDARAVGEGQEEALLGALLGLPADDGDGDGDHGIDARGEASQDARQEDEEVGDGGTAGQGLGHTRGESVRPGEYGVHLIDPFGRV